MTFIVLVVVMETQTTAPMRPHALFVERNTMVVAIATKITLASIARILQKQQAQHEREY